MSQLSAAHLRKRYKSRTVVHDVSLEVASGEVVGLLGPNGAGKTTCFYMIVGLVPGDGAAAVAAASRGRAGVEVSPQGRPKGEHAPQRDSAEGFL